MKLPNTIITPLIILLVFMPSKIKQATFEFKIEKITNIKYNVPFEKEITEYAKLYNLNIHLVLSIIDTESNFQVNAISEKGAMGIMQLHYTLFRNKLREDEDILDVKVNLRIGCEYLKHLWKKFQGNYVKVIKAYYTGEVLFKALEYSPDVEHYAYNVFKKMYFYQNAVKEEISYKIVY